MKRWFHKEDGGLIMLMPRYGAYWHEADFIAHCSICNRGWDCRNINEEILAAKMPEWIPFSDLPEDLQSVALSEML